jgi:hypothetical protein
MLDAAAQLVIPKPTLYSVAATPVDIVAER